jgi:hypothetical protein
LPFYSPFRKEGAQDFALCPNDLFARIGSTQDFTTEGEERQVAGTLDGSGQFALVFRTNASLAARANFPIVRYKTTKDFGLFIVNNCIFVSAELTFMRAGKETPWPAL